jgi:hypothetical protein
MSLYMENCRAFLRCMSAYDLESLPLVLYMYDIGLKTNFLNKIENKIWPKQNPTTTEDGTYQVKAAWSTIDF